MALPTYFCRSNEKLTQEVRVVNVFERDTYSEVPKRDIYSEVPLRDLKAWSCKDEVVHIRAEPGGVPLKNLWECFFVQHLNYTLIDNCTILKIPLMHAPMVARKTNLEIQGEVSRVL